MNDVCRQVEGAEQRSLSSRPIGSKEPISPYVLLFVMLVVAAIATWIVPSGEFSRTVSNGISFVVPNSLKPVAQHSVMPGEIFIALAKGMIASAPIIFLILFTGGALAVLEATGAVRSALAMATQGEARAHITVVVVCATFSLLGTLGVVTNSVVAFVPLGLLLAESMGLSTEIGVGLIYLGTYAGFNTGILNPVTTGFSQRLAGLPMFSGMTFRVCIYVAFVVATVIFLIVRIRAHQITGAAASVSIPEYRRTVPLSSPRRLGSRQIVVVGIVLICLSIFVYGSSTRQWAEQEMIAMFLIMAIASGAVCGIRPGKIADTFLQGCSGLVKGALVVGMARAISIVLSDGKILDTIVNMLAGLLAPLDSTMAAISMFLSAALIHVGISSGSGESAVLIPIFAPLGDTLHLTRQVTVQAVLLGEGFINCFNPTSGVLMAVLATSGIPYLKWVRFVMPLLFAWFAISIVAIATGVAMHWGPF